MAYSYETADAYDYSLLKQFAKNNRKNMTEAENHLWKFISKSQLGVPFRKQHIVGMFIADFICLPKRLIIEIDGGYHSLPEQTISDEKRTEYLQGLGYKVLRFTNEEVLFNIDNVIKQIRKYI